MAVVNVAGATFTVSIGGAALSTQITSGTISNESTITRTRTLGPDEAFTQTDLISSIDINYVFNDAVYGACLARIEDGTGVTVIITGGGVTWTGLMFFETASVEYDATGVATGSATATGQLTVS
jgi:hypothetical protein